MNPIMEKNLADLVIDQQLGDKRRLEPLSQEDRALVEAVVDRIFAYPSRKARARDSFRCNDPVGLMSALGLSQEHREALGGAELQLRIRDSKGDASSRRCALIALWQDENGSRTHTIQAFAAYRGGSENQATTLASVIGEQKTWRSADPGNAEYLDIVSILNAFPPEFPAASGVE